MTAVNGAPAPGADLGDLGALPGLETVGEQIAVLRAEQAAGGPASRSAGAAWKNLVFTAAPGTGQVPGGTWTPARQPSTVIPGR